MAQLGQLGGVGEAQRAREQAAIDLAQGQFQQELMFPEETLATYLRFITNAPSPSGFQRDVVAPGVPGPSALTQLAGGLAGGATLGKAVGLFNRGGAVPPALGRRAGLSGIVRRNTGGQIVRMQQGRQVRDYPGVPGLMLPIEDVPVTPFQTDVESVARSIEEFMPDTSSNIAKGLARAEAESDRRSAYFGGTQEELQDARERAAETERMIEAAKAAGMGFDEYIRDYENSGFAPSAPLEQSKPTKKTPEEETPAAEKPAGKAASFRVLPPAEPKPTETKSAFMSGLDNLSTGDLLKLSGAFFQAGSQGSTGNPFTDLTQFLGSAGVTAGDVINKAEKRKLAAADKKFLRGLKEREVKAAEDKGTAALMAAGKDKGEFKTPTTKDIEFTKAILQDGPYEKVSDVAVRQIAQIQKKYDKYSPQEIAAMLEASGALVIDDTGFWSFIGGGTPTLQTAGE